jgi:CHAT domain
VLRVVKNSVSMSEVSLFDPLAQIKLLRLTLQLNRGRRITCLEELLSKLSLLTGELGVSLSKSVRVLELCSNYGFRRAALVAALNLAHVMIYLNQTDKAGRILSEIRDSALRRRDDTLVARASYLLAIADARRRSLAAGVSITPNDSLQGFPFAALIYKYQYLIECFALSIGLTISTRNANRKQAVSKTLVVAMSDSTQSSNYDIKLASRPPLHESVGRRRGNNNALDITRFVFRALTIRLRPACVQTSHSAPSVTCPRAA